MGLLLAAEVRGVVESIQGFVDRRESFEPASAVCVPPVQRWKIVDVPAMPTCEQVSPPPHGWVASQ